MLALTLSLHGDDLRKEEQTLVDVLAFSDALIGHDARVIHHLIV